MAQRDTIIEALRHAGTGLDDDELARRAGIGHRQRVNALCRRLAERGVLRRDRGPDGKLLNTLVADAGAAEPLLPRMPVAVPDPDARDAVDGDARTALLAATSRRLEVRLTPLAWTHPLGQRVTLDGANADLTALVECSPNRGPARAAQRDGLLALAAKLQWVARSLPTPPHRLVLAVGDPAAVAHLAGRSWQAAAIRSMGVEILVVDDASG